MVNLTSGNNAFNLPSDNKYKRILSFIVQFGVYILPKPKIFDIQGDTTSLSIGISLNNNQFVLTTNSAWDPRPLYVLFFVETT